MIKSHKIQLNPTKAQKLFFAKAFGTARFTYNWAIDTWNNLHKEGINPSAMTLNKLLNSIKREQFPWMLEVTKTSPQYALWDVEDAFKRYFKRLKDGTIDKQKKSYTSGRLKKGLPINYNKLNNIGKPKFKKKGEKDSFVAVENSRAFKQQNKKIHIPRLGLVKCFEDLRFEGKVNNVVVKRVADKYFAVVNIEVTSNKTSKISESQAVIGVDLGIKFLATLSDGTVIENPKALKVRLKKLKRSHRGLSRKVKGSNNSKKQQLKLARLYYKVSNVRQNILHQTTTMLVKNYSIIAIENLNVKGMLTNHNIAQSVWDAGFGEFKRQLKYKAEWYGNQVVIVDRFYPSSKMCSNCGNKKEVLKLSERLYECNVCGHTQDRDLNASINLANIALRTNSTDVKSVEHTQIFNQLNSVAMKQKLN